MDDNRTITSKRSGDTGAGNALQKDLSQPTLSLIKMGMGFRGRHRYELLEQIGTGAFGVVWVAECIEPDTDAPDVPPKRIAIKFFNTSTGSESTAFIQRELAALLTMRSECIPRVYDWSVNPRISFFVMDYYPHGNLVDVFKNKSHFTDDETWRLLVDLFRALNVAHRAGVLHLDVKPANVMRDGKGGYLLLDFGISQANQVNEGSAQTIGAGSAGYQAPEQRRLELRNLDTRTDLWAVGATAWALRTGHNLSTHLDEINVAAAGAEPSLPNLADLCPDCSGALVDIIMNLLRDDREYRPGGAAEVLERIKSATTIQVRVEPHSAKGQDYDAGELALVMSSLMDPLWSSLCRRGDFARYFACFTVGEFLCRQHEAAHEAFVLLQGRVSIEVDEQQISVEHHEGTFLGELSTLTGRQRGASVCALETTWVCVFNAAELERLLAAHPAIGIRLVKVMAERLLASDEND